MSDSTVNAPQQARPGDVVRGKWLIDGATTLEEAAQRLEVEAARLRALHAQGWTLAEPIDSDYGHLVDPSGNAGDDTAED